MHSVIKLGGASAAERKKFPPTRFLEPSDIPALCNLDIDRMKQAAEAKNLVSDGVSVAVVPTADLVSWLHGRAEFYASQLYGKTLEHKGSVSADDSMWVYWHHDFRRDQLVIQRISCSGKSMISAEALASLLEDARNEALAWNLSAVAVWNPTPEVKAALEYLVEGTSDGLVHEERKRDVAMLRWRNGEKKTMVFEENEFFAWN